MARFTIVKGRPYRAVFVIKAKGSTTPIQLQPSDTATFTLSTIDNPPCLVLDRVSMNQGNPLNGEFILELDENQTSALEAKYGMIEDYRPNIANYKAVLDIITQEEGQTYSTIPEVYVESVGEACQTS